MITTVKYILIQKVWTFHHIYREQSYIWKWNLGLEENSSSNNADCHSCLKHVVVGSKTQIYLQPIETHFCNCYSKEVNFLATTIVRGASGAMLCRILQNNTKQRQLCWYYTKIHTVWNSESDIVTIKLRFLARQYETQLTWGQLFYYIICYYIILILYIILLYYITI